MTDINIVDKDGEAYETPSPFDVIWEHCVGFLAVVGFVFTLMVVALTIVYSDTFRALATIVGFAALGLLLGALVYIMMGSKK